MPFLTPLLALIIGILIGDSIQLPAWGLFPMLIACATYFFILRKTATPLLSLKHNKSHLVWIFLIFAGIGIFDIAFHKPTISSSQPPKGYILAEGEIIEAKSFASGDRFVVDVIRMVDTLSKVRTFHNFKILLSSDGFSADPGDIITFIPRLTPITDNPNFRPTGFTERMNRVGIYFTAHAKESEINLKGFNHTLANSAVAWRNRLVVKIEKSSLSRPTCSFIIALLLGDRSFLSEDVRDTFSNAGVAHVLALSGMHVAIIMGIILALLFPFKIWGWHRIRYIVAVLLVWAYAFFTGMSPSTVRACIMTTFVVVALIIQRRNSPENALLASAFIILLLSPQSLFDIGLQLSVLCVGSLLLFAGPLNPVNRHRHPALHSVVAAILVSLVATVTTWVVVSFYFNSVPLLFLPVNLCLLPVLPLYICLSVLFIILLIFGIDFSALAWILNKGYEAFDWIASHLSAFGNATVSFDIQMPVVILWLLGVLIIAYAIKRRSDKSKIILAGGLSLMIISIVSIPFLNDKPKDGIIFQKNSSDISLALYDGAHPQVSTMPRNTISRVVHKGCEILSIDCSENLDSLATTLLSSRKQRKRYLILGSGFKGTTLKDVPGLEGFDKIILHPSMKRKMETKLRQEAVEIGLNALYSLREEGPLEELLPDSLPIIR